MFRVYNVVDYTRLTTILEGVSESWFHGLAFHGASEDDYPLSSDFNYIYSHL